jgi:hypothetical protein
LQFLSLKVLSVAGEAEGRREVDRKVVEPKAEHAAKGMLDRQTKKHRAEIGRSARWAEIKADTSLAIIKTNRGLTTRQPVPPQADAINHKHRELKEQPLALPPKIVGRPQRQAPRALQPGPLLPIAINLSIQALKARSPVLPR